jgi:hypothetical protein
MKPVLVALDASRYARALSYLHRAIRCYHQLDEVLVAAYRDDALLAPAHIIMPRMEGALYGAMKLLTRRSGRRSIWRRPHR